MNLLIEEFVDVQALELCVQRKIIEFPRPGGHLWMDMGRPTFHGKLYNGEGFLTSEASIYSTFLIVYDAYHQPRSGDTARLSFSSVPEAERHDASVRRARRAVREALQRRVAAGKKKDARPTKPQRKVDVKLRRAQKNAVMFQSYKDLHAVISPLPVEDEVFVNLSPRQRANPDEVTPQMFGAVRRTIVNAGTLINKLDTTAETLTSAATNADGVFNMLKDAMDSFISGLKAIAGKAVWTIPLLALLYLAYDRFGWSTVPAGAILLGVNEYVLPDGLWDTVKHFFNRVQPQGPTEVLSKLMASVGTFCFMGKKKDTEDVVNEVYRRIGNFDKTSAGIESILEFIKDSMYKIVRYFQLKFSPDRAKFLESIVDPLERWMAQIDLYETQLSVNSRDVDTDTLDALVALCQDGSSFKEVFRGSPTMSRRVEEYYKKVKILLAPHLGSLGARNNYRVEPEMGMFVGTPAIGKTLLIGRLANSVLIRSGLCTPKDVQANVWQKGTSKYWNSYCKQKCVVFDDAFQKRANASDEESEYMDIIRMIGSWSFPLNMADVESKGRSFFGSALVVGTTNLSCIASECAVVVNEPQAVIRRIKHSYRVKVSPEYADPEEPLKLDYAKFYSVLTERLATMDETSDPDDIYPWDAWQFYKHDFNTGMSGTMPISPLVVVAEIADALKQKHLNHNADKEMISTLDELLYKKVTASAMPQAGSEIMESLASEETMELVRQIRRQNGRNLRSHSVVEDDFHESVERQDWQQHGVFHVEPTTMWINGEEYWAGPVPAGVVLNDVVTPPATVHQLEVRREYVCFRDRFKACVRNFLDFMSCNKWYFVAAGVGAVAIAGLMGACMGLWTFFRNLFKKKEVVVATLEEAPEVKEQSNKPLNSRPALMAGTNVRFQALGDATPHHDDSAVHDTIYANSYKMWLYKQFTDEDGTDMVQPVIIGQVTFVNQSVAMMPHHFYDYLSKQPRHLRLRMRNGSNAELEYGSYGGLTVGGLLDMPRHSIVAHDVCFIDFARLAMKAHRSIDHHMIREDQVRVLRAAPKSVRLDVAKVDVDGKISKRNGRIVYIAHRPVYLDQLLSGKETVQRVWEYTVPTAEGDCGAPLTVVSSNTLGRTLIGFHIAGDGSALGYSAIVTQEMYQEAAKKMGAIRDNLVTAEKQCGREIRPLLEHEKPQDLNSGSFLVIGKVDKGSNMNPKSSIKPSALIGCIDPPVDIPIRLSPYMENGEKVYPMKRAYEANKSDVRIIDPEDPLWIQAMHVAGKLFMQETANVDRRILSFEEAIVGDPVLKLKAINRSSSAGYPYLLQKQSGKKAFFGVEDEYNLNTPACDALRKDVNALVAAAADGVRSPVIYNDFLKDERRSPEKYNAGMARLISSSPLHYTVAVRMYYGNILSAMFANSVVTGLAPGMCTYQDWTLLATRLSKFGEAVFDGDFKRFDSTQQPGLLYIIRDWINEWFGGTDEEKRIRDVLFEDLVHSRHIGGDGTDQTYIYQWNKCLPSGNPLTTLINSLFSLLLLVYAYIRLTGDATGFWEHCFANTFGDDNICNVDADTVDRYNLVTVRECLAELGMVYTAGSKEATERPYQSLSECTFLKRGFRWEDGLRQWLCPLALNSFMQTFYWCKNPMFYHSTIISDIENALQELSMWPEEEWQSKAPLLVDALHRHDRSAVTMAPVRRDSYLRIVLSRTDWY